MQMQGMARKIHGKPYFAEIRKAAVNFLQPSGASDQYLQNTPALTLHLKSLQHRRGHHVKHLNSLCKTIINGSLWRTAGKPLRKPVRTTLFYLDEEEVPAIEKVSNNNDTNHPYGLGSAACDTMNNAATISDEKDRHYRILSPSRMNSR